MPYLDNFNISGSTLKIRDLEAREIIAKFADSISGSVGNSNRPIFLDKGNFKECNDILNVNISGNASSATEANHATSADSATEATHATSADSAINATNATNANHATSADSATEATHATSADSATEANHATSADRATNATKATNANHATEANHATSADSATNATNATNANHATSADSATNANYANSSGTTTHTDNKNVNVFTHTNGDLKTMDGYIKEKTYNITNDYSNQYYANVSIPIPSFFSGILSIVCTVQGGKAVYFTVTNYTNNTINGYLVCPESTSANLSIFFHVVGY